MIPDGAFQNDILFFNLVGFVNVFYDIRKLLPYIGASCHIIVCYGFHQFNGGIDALLSRNDNDLHIGRSP